jgi:hypothetical protein
LASCYHGTRIGDRSTQLIVMAAHFAEYIVTNAAAIVCSSSKQNQEAKQ